MLETKHQFLNELYLSSSVACRRICKSLPGIITHTVNELLRGGAGAVLGIAALLKPVALKPKPRAEPSCNKTVSFIMDKDNIWAPLPKAAKLLFDSSKGQKTYLSPFTWSKINPKQKTKLILQPAETHTLPASQPAMHLLWVGNAALACPHTCCYPWNWTEGSCSQLQISTRVMGTFA